MRHCLCFIIVYLSYFPSIFAQQIVINEIMTANASAVMDLDYFNYSEWIELYNPGEQAVNIYGYSLTNDSTDLFKWQLKYNYSIPAKGFKVIWMDKLNTGLHTNFRARSNDEIFILSDKTGQLVDSVHVNRVPRNTSYSRYPDGAANWRIFEKSTPNEKNIGIVVNDQSPEPIFSLPGGRYNTSQTLVLTNPISTGKIYFTTDGSEPGENSDQYTTPITINTTKTIKARIIESRKIYGETVTNTYFIREHTFTIPVVSVSTDPKNLWDPMIGIYTEGSNGVEGYCYGQANWNQEWERLASFEYFTPDGVRKIRTDAGLKINGGCSRTFSQKSLGVYFRDKYGTDEIRYPFFESKGVDRFKSIMLRNSGNDFNRTQFQDAMMQTLLIGQMDIDYLGYTPAALYLNGNYWGVQNIREKSSEDYLFSNYHLDDDSVDMLEWQNSIIVGDNADYDQLLDFLGSHDLSDQDNYNYVRQQIDMESYLDYQIAQIYFANQDWPGNNIKFWKPKRPGSAWRWLLFDTDFGFGLYSSPDHNTLTFASETNGPDWPNPPWSTFLFRKLLENQEFRDRFVDKFCVYINSTFNPGRVSGIIDSLRNNIAAEMPYHFNRWGGSILDWEWNINVSRDFGNRRPGYMMQYLQDFFGLSTPVSLEIGSNLAEKQRFSVNEILIQDATFKGSIFTECPVIITAHPGKTARFKHWEIKTFDVIREEIITKSSEWSYLDDGTEPAANWNSATFNDSGWKSGSGQFGYGDGDETTQLDFGPDTNNKYISYYFRKKFDVSDISGSDSLILRILSDDGAVVYINSHEILRENMPDGIIMGSTLAIGNPLDENAFLIRTLDPAVLLPGENLIAVEVHQASPSSSDVSFDLSLDLLMKQNQQTEIDFNPELLITLTASSSFIACFDTVDIIRDLYINEFCTKNTVIPDEVMEYDDWIELYNAGNDTVDVGGLYMTNDLGLPLMYKIPFKRDTETLIPPGEYILLWADEQPEQGTLHLDFNLGKSGGDIAVVQLIHEQPVVLDSVVYQNQYTNYSFGRYGDGTNRWFVLSGMTPGETNVYTDVADLSEDQYIDIYPNPVRDFLELRLTRPSTDRLDISIFDQLGRERMNHTLDGRGGRVDVSFLAPGFYFISVIMGKDTHMYKILKLQ